MTRADFSARLEREIGLDLEVLGEQALGRLIASGMRRTSEKDEIAYLSRVASEPKEWEVIIEDVVVPETWFLRDRRPFELISRWARTWLSKSGRTLRALSLPCSTGEEAYSIALALSEAGLSPSQFRILAFDLSARNLEHARAGIYKERVLRLVTPGARQRYFKETEGGFEVATALRRRIEFKQGNALDPHILSDQQPFDLILCRNLMIYLTNDARRILLRTLEARLAVDGVLIVGHAERTRLVDECFDAIEERGCFAYRKRAKTKAGHTPHSAKAQSGQARKLKPAVPRSGVDVAKHDAVPLPVPETDLDAARRLANEGCHEHALAACERAIQREGPSATAFHLMGSIRQASGEPEVAEQLHRRAIYLEPNHSDALLALSLIARRKGDVGEAERLAQRAERALKREVP
jgi:chemotaxis protein methyltransferase WspC